MKGFIANTDHDWYTFLRSQEGLEEVNFWQPSGGPTFKAIEPGAPFIFRLKAPLKAIAGIGHFFRYRRLPDWLAWEAFGTANGAPDYETMRRRIEKYRKQQGHPIDGKYEIGCIMVTEPVLFAPDSWVGEPNDWRIRAQKGITYDLTTGEGRRVWEDCLARTEANELTGVGESRHPRYGEPYLVKPRLGQGSFRIAVTDAYDCACSVSTERSLPALDAAHIRPYAKGGIHEVPNGVLLRSDIHRLYDKGYVTITPDLRFEVSKTLREDWENGHSYDGFHGRKVVPPRSSSDRPDRRLLEWHCTNVFRG